MNASSGSHVARLSSEGAAGVSSAAMDLEPRTIERVGERCEECGATLTPAELKAVMESGGPALCTVHAAEVEALPEPDEAA